MPQLSSQQQATVDAANAALAAAKSALDAANADLGAKKTDMTDYYNSYMVNCKYKWDMPSLGQLWETDGCDGQVNASKHPGCGSKDTCKQRVTEYNGKVGSFNAAVTNVDTKQSAFNTAKDNLDAVMNAIKNDPVIAGGIAVEINKEDEKAKAERLKWIFFGLIALLVVGAAVFVFIKMRTKSA